MDDSTTVKTLKQSVVSFRDARDWKKFHTPKDLAASISIEANELLELFQWKTPQEAQALLDDSTKMQEIRDEIADIVIYCLSASDSMEFDLSEAVAAKLQKNEEKYPVEKAKGNSKKYTEL
ncbi:nucleotide pyrophosphohydrolase [Candidatus Micrarchaeota archaeon]|nr:nucleotide pyrophosphohydrolase [Candidatus Micrarchaeota archaeon]